MGDGKERKSDDKPRKTETHAKPAGLIDQLTGNEGEHGEKLENGHPVMETVEKKD